MSYFMISAAHKSSGKTTISIGLCAALRNKGLVVQPFKKGPDYIDPLWLSEASGRPCHNLDFFTQDKDEIQEVFSSEMQGADIGVIEGNKGLYDGLDLDGSNSNAALAAELKAPVILVLDTRGMTRGVAPLILGYQAFEAGIRIAGVILNHVGGSRHEGKLRRVIEHYTDVPVIGAVAHDPGVTIEERHLGLIPSNEQEQAQGHIQRIAQLVTEQVDLDRLQDIASRPELSSVEPQPLMNTQPDLRIGYAKDEAFGFYYPGDIGAFQKLGAELVPIDLINDEALPKVDGLFIGGGFPETRMTQLGDNLSMRHAIASFIQSGGPVYAECGGLMYLCRSIEWQGEKSEMAGVIPADALMHERPQGRGYVRLKAQDTHPWPNQGSRSISCHEFHYSSLEAMGEDLKYIYKVTRGFGVDGHRDGIHYKNLVASYSHLRHTKNNPWVANFLDFVRTCKSIE